MKKKIIEGQKFCKLTTIKYDNINYNPPRWKCSCECGNIIYVRTALLNNGQVKSCGCTRIKEKSITKNPYYSAFMKYNQRHKNKFSTIEDYIIYRKKKINNQKIKPTLKIKQWWKQINDNQNGDFDNLESFSKWCEKKKYNNDCFVMRKKYKTKPYSKKNLQFGIFYKDFFITSYQFNKYNFNFDKNKKLFYGYIKFKGNIILTNKYEKFEDMILEYCFLYKKYFGKNFTFT